MDEAKLKADLREFLIGYYAEAMGWEHPDDMAMAIESVDIFMKGITEFEKSKGLN